VHGVGVRVGIGVGVGDAVGVAVGANVGVGVGDGATLRAISPASVQIGSEVSSTPDDHFMACPDRCVRSSGRGRVGRVGSCPGICHRIVSSTGVKSAAHRSAPNDHFAAGPDRRVKISGTRRVRSGSGRPNVSVGIISPAGVQPRGDAVSPQTIISMPVQTAV